MDGKFASAAITISTLGIVLGPNKNNSAKFSALNLKQFSSYLKKTIFSIFFFKINKWRFVSKYL